MAAVEAPPRRRGRRLWVALLVVIVVLGALFVVAGGGASAGALPDGQVQVKVPVSFAGVSTTIVATGNLTVGQGVAHLKINQVSSEGGALPSVISGLIGSIKQSLSVDIKIPPLPYGMVVKDVKASEQGLAVTATAANVALSGGS